MSNRSSHVGARDILLKGGAHPENLSALDLANRPNLTEQPRFKSSDAFRLLNIKNLEIFSPVGLSEPTVVDPSVFGIMGSAYTNDPDSEIIKCKIGENYRMKPGYVPLVKGDIPLYAESEEKIHPMYRPSYFSAPVDQAVIKQSYHFYFNAIGQGPDGPVERMRGFVEDENSEYIWGEGGLIKVAETHAYTSGTLSGQIERIKQNKDVATGAGIHHKNKGLHGLNYSVDQMCTLLQKTLPLPKVTDMEQLMPLIYNIKSLIYFEKDEETKNDYLFYSRLPKYERETKAGMPYPQKTLKKEVPWSVYLHMLLFLQDLAKAMQEQGTQKHIKKVLRDWWYLSVFYIFPKAERYKLVKKDYNIREKTIVNNVITYNDKVETRLEAEKTRNIYSTPFISHMLASLLVNQIEDYGQLNVDNYDTPSLYKWTPYLGGMDRLLLKMQAFMDRCKRDDDVKSAFTLIYADNWYVLKPYKNEHGEIKFQYSSEDLTKGESNATRDMQSAFAHYVLHSFFVVDKDNKKYVMFDSVMAYLFRVIIPSWFVNSTGLIGNMLVKFFGQASGNTWTFYTNHVLTTILDNEYKNIGSPILNRDTREKLMERTGIDFKVEFQDDDFEKSILDCVIKNKEIEGYFPIFSENINDDFSGVRKPSILKLDLLGYDAVYVPNLGAFVPVLSEDRLLKAIVLPKNFKTDNNLVRLVYNNIRYNSLIMVGAWAYPVLHRALSALVQNSFKPFIKVQTKLPVENIAREVELPYDLAQLLTPEIMKYLGGVNQPPDDEFFLKLFTGEPLQTPPVAKYHPIINFSSDKNKAMLFVTPGMSYEQNFTEDPSYVANRWGDIDNGVAVSTPYTKMYPTKYVGYYSIRTTKTNRLNTVFNFTNEVIMYNNAERLYLKSLDDDNYAKFKTKLTDPQKLNPTEANVYYDPKTGRTSKKGVKLPSENPTLEDFRIETLKQGRNWQTRKRNLSRRKPGFDFGDDTKEREFVRLNRSQKVLQRDFDELERKLVRFNYLALDDDRQSANKWKTKLNQLEDYMTKDFLKYMSDKYTLLNDKDAIKRYLKAVAATERDEELEQEIEEEK